MNVIYFQLTYLHKTSDLRNCLSTCTCMSEKFESKVGKQNHK